MSLAFNIRPPCSSEWILSHSCLLPEEPKSLSFRFIELYNCNITDEQSVRIAESVSEHPSLEEFKLGSNRIGNVGCGLLVTALLNGSIINNLLTLDLQGNNIRLRGTCNITSRSEL